MAVRCQHCLCLSGCYLTGNYFNFRKKYFGKFSRF